MTETLPVVSRFESHLLRLLQFALGHGEIEQVRPLITTRFAPVPGCLSRTCVRLVENTLAQGVVLFLTRTGGWQRERFIRGDGVAEGRVWDRHSLDAMRLEFGPHLLEFLRWLTAENPDKAVKPEWDVPSHELTAGDEIALAIFYDRLRDEASLGRRYRKWTVFQNNGLCRLLHPADFDGSPPPLDPWTTGVRAIALECLQKLLAMRWIRSERAKVTVRDWQAMAQQGQAENAVLTTFLAAAETAGRPDLARFVLDIAANILTIPDLTPAFWTGGLSRNRPARLAERLAVERSALAIPQQLATLQRWDRLARTVGYWDEGYEASQVWKADWEAARGDELASIADRLLSQLEPL